MIEPIDLVQWMKDEEKWKQPERRVEVFDYNTKSKERLRKG